MTGGCQLRRGDTSGGAEHKRFSIHVRTCRSNDISAVLTSVQRLQVCWVGVLQLS